MFSQKSLSHSGCAWPRHFRTSCEVPEPEDTRSCCRKSGEEPDGVLQPEYDGGLGVGSCKISLCSMILAPG
jgi:hypothetical protein